MCHLSESPWVVSALVVRVTLLSAVAWITTCLSSGEESVDLRHEDKYKQFLSSELHLGFDLDI